MRKDLRKQLYEEIILIFARKVKSLIERLDQQSLNESVDYTLKDLFSEFINETAKGVRRCIKESFWDEKKDFNGIVPKEAYELLKILNASDSSLTEKEIKSKAKSVIEPFKGLEDYAWNYLYETMSERTWFWKPLIKFSDNIDWNKGASFEITDAGKEAIRRYEEYKNYKDEKEIIISSRKQTSVYIIFDKKSGQFVKSTGSLNYAAVLAFTENYEDAKKFKTKKEAEDVLKWFFHQIPWRNQLDLEEYGFVVKEIKPGKNKIKVSKTFICRQCGKIFPTEKRFVSTTYPNCVDTGLCVDCHNHNEGREQMKEYNLVHRFENS